MKLFRTDGIRGAFGEPPLDQVSLMRLALAMAKVCHVQGIERVVIARDTRESGPVIQQWLSTVLMQNGLEVLDLGVLPTPGLAYQVGLQQAGLGIMITASHNLYQDNGIKLFSATGAKVATTFLEAIEARYAELDAPTVFDDASSVKAGGDIREVVKQYGQFCIDAVKGLDLSGWHIVLDTAHGAMFEVAPYVFEQLGACVHVVANQPTGKNINDRCGATHTDLLQSVVLEQKADIGFAFDGDGDRLQVVNAKGESLDGDDVLWVLSRYFRERGDDIPSVVGTVMSNLGLEVSLKALGVGLLRTAVGDQNMYTALKEHDLPLAAETSGHILYLPSHETGDALIAALWFLEACVASGCKPSEACGFLQQGWQRFAQASVSVPIPNAASFESAWCEALNGQAKMLLGDQGRAVIRPSGTEPVVRIMVESQSQNMADDVLQTLVDQLKEYWR